MRQHDQPKLELHRDGNARTNDGGIAAKVRNRRKKHCDRHSGGERQHVHGSKEMPNALHQREKKTQRVKRLSHVVLVEIGIAKKSSSDVMVIKQPGNQGKNWNQGNHSALEAASTAVIATRQDFPKRECKRRDHRSLFAQDGQAKGKLAGPYSVFDIKPDSPKRKCGSHEIGMRQRTLHKKDWVNGSGDGCGYSNASTHESSREQKYICQGKRRKQKHGYPRYGWFPAADSEPQCKICRGKWRMSRIKRGLGNQSVRMREIVSGRNIEAGFVPEEGKPQERRVQQKNDDKDQRVKSPEREFRQFVSSWRDQWLRFSPERALVNLALLRRDIGIKLDFAERAFILAHILLQDGQQCFGLLRTQIDALKILHFDLLRRHRLQAAKNQQKVPYADANLY